MKTITCQDPLPKSISKWTKSKDGEYIETLTNPEIIKVKCVCGHCGEDDDGRDE